MGTNQCSQPASKSSWDSQDFGDVNMVLKMVHFDKSSRPQWVKPACIILVHYSDVIMSAMASQITGVSIVYFTVCSGADQRKHQSSASLAFVRGIHRWPVNSPHKEPVTRKTLSFDYVLMNKDMSFKQYRNVHPVHNTILRTLAWRSGERGNGRMCSICYSNTRATICFL